MHKYSLEVKLVVYHTNPASAAPVDMASSFQCYAEYTHLHPPADTTDPGMLSSL